MISQTMIGLINLQNHESLTKKRPTQRALDGWDAKRQCALAGRRSLVARPPDLRHFQALSMPEQNPALEVLSTPAHPQVSPLEGHRDDVKGTMSQTVGRFAENYSTCT
jgi:hypothetical protein